MEGYQTYLGGTAGRSFDEVVKTAAAFYRDNPGRDVIKDLVESYRIHGNLYVVYPIGGLICKISDERFGFDGIKRLFRFGLGDEGFFIAADSVLGIKKSDLSHFLREQLSRYN